MLLGEKYNWIIIQGKKFFLSRGGTSLFERV